MPTPKRRRNRGPEPTTSKGGPTSEKSVKHSQNLVLEELVTCLGGCETEDTEVRRLAAAVLVQTDKIGLLTVLEPAIDDAVRAWTRVNACLAAPAVIGRPPGLPHLDDAFAAKRRAIAKLQGYVALVRSRVRDAAAPLPLSKNARAVLELLRQLGPEEALSGPEILDDLDRAGTSIDQSTLTKNIIPALEAYGVRNLPRVGYYIARPKAD